jgi:hypothetical protein
VVKPSADASIRKVARATKAGCQSKSTEVVGSTADLLSRIIGQRLGEALGQPVAYENLFLEAGVEEGMK